MLTIENVQLFGFQAAIRGMRNPKNSWAKGDSTFVLDTNEKGVQTIDLGPADRRINPVTANAPAVYGGGTEGAQNGETD